MSAVVDVTGQRFSRLLVLGRGGSTNRGQALWLCRCDCGNTLSVRGPDLRKGHTRSCGCLVAETAAGIADKHNRTHGMSDSPIYVLWRNMLRRCTDPRAEEFASYGGRGITVCEEWLSFERFYADFGSTQPSARHSIDRRDNDAGYHIGNVRWALPIEQANNRRDNVRITHQGATLTLAQWARRVGVSVPGLSYRLKRGWPLDLALSLPANPHQRITT